MQRFESSPPCRTRLTIAAILVVGFAIPTAETLAQPVAWTQRMVSGPTPRLGHAMIYDATRSVTVLFGGRDSNSISNAQTWEWDGTGGGNWTQRATTGPSPRSYHAMTYDSARNVTVLFGGFNAGHSLGETWEWSGTGAGGWTQHAVSGPSPRFNAGMVYDSARGVSVLFGGNSAGIASSETWEWNGTVWTQRVVPGPSPRTGHGMAYDSARGVTVLFGGAVGTFNAETWEWDGNAWIQRIVTGPSARQTSMIYDATRGVTVLFGGFTSLGARSNETWEWNGTAGVWTRRFISGPSGRESHAMAYDVARSAAVLFGGTTQVNVANDETWELQTGSPCTPPSITTQPSSQAVCSGATASITTAAAGTSPTYQWQVWNPQIPGWDTLADGISAGVGTISGAQSLSLSITPLGGFVALAVRCLVTNLCGSATTTTATLTPNLAPSISQQPQDTTACPFGPATLFVSVNGGAGTGPFAYQWRENGDPINTVVNPSAATATLMLSNVVHDEAYDCIVTNACGGVTSSSATLTVFAGGTGDGNGDGLTDGLDIQSLMSALLNGGSPSAGYCAYDLSGNGSVDPGDIDLFVDRLLAP